jgi:hypothetical protein
LPDIPSIENEPGDSYRRDEYQQVDLVKYSEPEKETGEEKANKTSASPPDRTEIKGKTPTQ